MTALRQKMIEDMQLHGFAERTQDSYLRAHPSTAVGHVDTITPAAREETAGGAQRG